MNAANVHLIFRTEYLEMFEICLLKGENDSLLQVFGNLPKFQMNVLPK